jgi:glycosyltransferase involved in cell wall biosynthesis
MESNFDKHPLRILYVSSHWPRGNASGSQLRALHVARALAERGEVHVMVVGAEENEPESIKKTASEFKVALHVNVVRVVDYGITRRVSRAFDPRCAYPHGLAIEPQGEAWMQDTLPEFDMVWFFKLRTANMFRRWSWPRSVVDIDDIPSTYMRASGKTAPLRQRFNALQQTLVWRRRERLLGERFNVLGVCSEGDRRYLSLETPVHVIPNGFESSVMEPDRKVTKAGRIGFIGLFDHPPNIEGIRWFVRECWPEIKRQAPDSRLRLIGKFSAGSLNLAGPDIDTLGWVPDSGEEIATWSAMIVPIQFGAGTRVKIAEAFSRKCPVVSTRFGAYGYDVQDGDELFLADRSEHFAAACLSLIREPAKGTAMAERAWQLFANQLTWKSITPRIHAAAEDCLRRSRNPSFNGLVK